MLWRIQDASAVRMPVSPSRPEADIPPKEKYSSKLINRGGQFGFLVAAYPATQFLLCPVIAVFIKRCGERSSLLCGNALMFLSVVAYAYPMSYAYLLVFRIVQGLSSGLVAVAGFSYIAHIFANDEAMRGKMLARIFTAISLGMIGGPIFGSTIYDYVGTAAPFSIIAAIIFFCLVSQLLPVCISAPEIAGSSEKKSKQTHFRQVVRDPSVMTTVGIYCLANINYAVLLAFVPLRLIELGTSDVWKFGVALAPLLVLYAVATLVAPYTTPYSPRWLTMFSMMSVYGVILAWVSLAGSFITLMFLLSLIGSAHGAISTAISPTLALLADLHHDADYTTIYGISNMAACVGYAAGASLGGLVSFHFSTSWLFLSLAVVTLAASYSCFFLKIYEQSRPRDRERTVLIRNTTIH